MRALAAIVVVVLFGCTYESSETYRASQTGQKLHVEYAVVQTSREVTITEDPDLDGRAARTGLRGEDHGVR